MPERIPDLKLYHALFSTCSQKVRFVLAKKGLDYESRIVDLGKGEHLEDGYLAINPNGVVPALSHGDCHITDSSVICEYLDEVFPQPPLSPADPVARAQMRAWMRYFEEVPTAAIRAPSFNQLFARQISRIPQDEQQRRQDKMPLRKQFYAKMGPEGFPQEQIDESMERLDTCLKRVEQAAAAAGPFLLGEAMTLADIVLLPSVVRMEDLGLTQLWAQRPHVQRWYTAMQADPAFAITYQAGSRFS